MTGEADPFRDYHRARRRLVLGRALASMVGSVGLFLSLVFLAGAAPEPAEQLLASPALPRSAASSAPRDAPVELPAPLPALVRAPVEAAPPAAVLPVTGPESWSIGIDTRGYQAEIDQCQWVRMDLGAQAPIVGAHNYCGGGVVLQMALGDTVTLTGTGLDGTYRVTDSRDARAGDTAATAIAGMVGSVILQTCYWADDGTERLVGLLPEPVA